MSRLVAALAAAVLLASPIAALGEDDAAAAKARFHKGAELYGAGKWREAIEEFEAAYRLKPAGAIHFNVARCREKLGEWPGALRAYEDYLREVPDANDRANVRASMKRIEQRLAAAGVQALLVYTDPPGAELRLDGRARGKTPFHTVLPPGTYALSLSLEGYQPVAEDVDLTLSASRVVDLVLRPASPGAAGAGAAAAGASGAPAAPDLAASPQTASTVPLAPAPATPPARSRVYTWIAAGATAAAVATGAYFGWSASKDEDALKSMSAPSGSDAQRYASSAESNARKANTMYAVAGAAAAAGVTLFFVEGRF
jgi:tetratricopeptide (TPR) repeat protein